MILKYDIYFIIIHFYRFYNYSNNNDLYWLYFSNLDWFSSLTFSGALSDLAIVFWIPSMNLFNSSSFLFNLLAYVK